MPSQPERTGRPLLAFLDPTLTPYRLHFQRRVVSELGVRVLSLHLRPRDFFPWTLEHDGGADLELRCLGTDGIRGLGGLPGLFALLRERQARAVVLGGYGDITRAAMLLEAHRRGLPCLLFGDSNARAVTGSRARRALKNLLLPPLLRRSSAVLACGQLGRGYFLRYGVPPERIFLSPYEPDYASIQNLRATEVEERARSLGLEQGRLRVLFSGRLAAEKRVDLALDAFACLAADRPAWDLVLLGDGPLAASLQARARSLGARVRFLGFQSRPELLAAVYRSSHVLVLPSDYEPWGVVVNEARAAGLALVCSDVVGAAADLLRDGVDGRMFPAGDLGRLVDALRDVTDPDRLDGYRRAGADTLADWRAKADPVSGLEAALEMVGVDMRPR